MHAVPNDITAQIHFGTADLYERLRYDRMAVAMEKSRPDFQRAGPNIFRTASPQSATMNAGTADGFVGRQPRSQLEALFSQDGLVFQFG